MATPLIDRQKSILPENIATLTATDAILSVSNNTRFFSPLNNASIFYGKAYVGSTINIYTGFRVSATEVKVINQLTVYLKEIDVEAKTNIVKLVCIGNSEKLKNTKIGAPLSDGTADPLIYVGSWTFKNIVEDLLGTYVGIASSGYEVSDITLSFTNASFDNITVETAIEYLCQAASCEVFEGRDGKIIIKSFVPSWGTSTAIELKASTNILSATSVFNNDDLIFKIAVTGATSVYAEEEITANVTGRVVELTNAYLQSNSEAQDVVDKFVERFGTAPILIELDIDYMPALDLGDIVFVTEEESDIAGQEFEVYRITLNLENFSGKAYLLQSYYTVAYLFYNSNGASNFYSDPTAYDSKFGFYADRDNPTTGPQFKLL